MLQHTPKITPPPSPSQNAPLMTADVEQDEAPKAELDLCTGPKDAYIVEVYNNYLKEYCHAISVRCKMLKLSLNQEN